MIGELGKIMDGLATCVSAEFAVEKIGDGTMIGHGKLIQMAAKGVSVKDVIEVKPDSHVIEV